MNLDERIKVVKDKRLCYRCLVFGHPANRCRREETKCGKCSSTSHHELLHPLEKPVVTSRAAMSGKNIYLMVVPVQVRAKNGNQISTLALLDNGSDTSLCAESLRRKLGVSGQRVRYTSVTINGEESKEGLAIDLTVKGKDEQHEIMTRVLTVDSIPSSNDAVPTKDDLQRWNHLKDLPVSDAYRLTVDLLIGADNPEAFWVMDERRNKPKDPYAIKTPLGWCVMGPVSCIRNSSKPEQWRHVLTEDSPADEGSRGTLELKKWIIGPDFLLRDEATWPTNKHQITQSSDPEVKIKINATQTRENQKNVVLEGLTEKMSSWTRLIRVYAYVLRFIARCKRATDAKSTSLSVAEIQGSELSIIAWIQRTEFVRWVSDQRLKAFQPVLMGDVLRVGGRIDQSKVNESTKHPIILPAYTNVSKLIIRHYHQAVGHSGWMSTLNALRRKYWLLKGRTAVKSALSGCVICKRYGARPAQQLMAELPAERLDDSTPPFTNVGVDFFGPFDVKVGRSKVKRYGCIFTCLISRAVHLELANSLDTDAFINALRRFVARRGQPKLFISDNGTNLHGGERELREVMRKMKGEEIEDFCNTRGFQWKFNPAHASHFGGVWERLIRSVRRVLNGVLCQQRLTEDVLATALAEVENILNSRPLTDMSYDPTDAEPLTLNHLLLLREGPPAPVDNITDKSLSYGKKRWLQAQYLASLFWTRWRREYLPLLQKRNKWTTPKENVMVNNIVLLVDEISPRGKWPLGRVLEVRRSKDGKVRSVDVRVNNNILKRPIAKLCIVYRDSIARTFSV